MDNCVRLTFLSVPDNVGIARVVVAAVAGQAGFALNELEEIKVAVSEAVSNAIIHGYRYRRDGWVDVEAWLEDSRLRVVVRDEGVGIEDIEQARQPSYSTDPERMGLGFVFMETFMDSVQVTSQIGVGTQVEMSKTISMAGELSADAR